MLPFVPKASSPSSLPTHLTLTRTGNVHDDDAMIPAGLSSSSTFVADRDTQEPRSHALSSSSCSSPATPVCSCGPSGSAGEMQNLISLISHKVVQELKSSASSSSSSSSPPSPSGETVNQQQSHRHPHRHPDTVLSIAELILRAVDKVTVSAAPHETGVASANNESTINTTNNSDTDNNTAATDEKASVEGGHSSSTDGSGGLYHEADIWSPDFWSSDVLELASKDQTRPRSSDGKSCREEEEAPGVIEVRVRRRSSTTSKTPARRSSHRSDCSETSTATSSTAFRKRSLVQFGEVHIRAYEQVAGDNPSCTSGPPLALGWRFIKVKPISVTEFEKARAGFRRNKSQFLLLSKERREAILRQAGVSEGDIAEAVRSANKVRNLRRQTINNLAVDEAFENASKLLKRIISKSKSNQSKVIV